VRGRPPNPAILTAGGSTVTVTVTTTPIGNFDVPLGWSGLDPDPPSFDQKTVLTLTLNWRGDRAWPGVSTATTDPPQIRT
jgi:hypothetical protein